MEQLETDEFGDFRWNEAAEERYAVEIRVPGFDPIVLEADCTKKDVVFDDVLIDQRQRGSERNQELVSAAM